MNAVGELHRPIRSDKLPDCTLRVTATQQECAALAARFGLPAVHSLAAEVEMVPDGHAVKVAGTLVAEIEQSCAVAGEPFGQRIEDDIAIRFVPAETFAPGEAEEVELGTDDLDDIPFEGREFDLGEAIAQSLALAIDPYAEGPNADAARREAGLLGEAEAGPFAALAALKAEPSND